MMGTLFSTVYCTTHSLARLKNIPFLLLVSISLSACTPARYQHQQDFTPQVKPDVSKIEQAVPVSEPRSSLGNNDSYQVEGKTYQLEKDPDNYKVEGKASWYGMKFHGHKTSNGETYDVNKMTAAHKTLPLPSYVKVSLKQAKEKSVIVRVNDRGPFHNDRVIDLSYAAAVQLGVDQQGVAEVEIEVVAAPKDYAVKWAQILASKSLQRARELKKQLMAIQSHPVIISASPTGNLFKVRIGPIQEGPEIELLLQLLKDQGFSQPLLLGKHQL